MGKKVSVRCGKRSSLYFLNLQDQDTKKPTVSSKASNYLKQLNQKNNGDFFGKMGHSSQGCHYDLELPGKYNKYAGNHTARDFFWLNFSSIFQ